MNASHARRLSCPVAILLMAGLWQSAAWAQDQAAPGARALPSVTIGPAPVSKRPRGLVSPQKPAARPPSVLRLRLDPNSGQALTPQQMEARAKRNGKSPRSLRPPPPAGKIGAAANTGGAVGGDGIQMKTLKRVKVSAIGLLNEAAGGLGDGMWAGTSLSLVMALLPRLPIATASPSMQSLRRRLLVSTAIPPQEDGADGAADTDNDQAAGDQAAGPGGKESESGQKRDGTALVAARIERLAASGDTSAVAQLLQFAPLTMENKVYARVRMETELLNGNVREACRLARNRIGNENIADGAAIWQKVLAFCLALDGQTAQVELFEQLLYENGVRDEAYFTLLSGLSGGEAEPLVNMARTGPLHLAMLRAARRAIPATAVPGASPAVMRAIATSPNASLALRLDAAERAEAMGVLDTAVLRRVYASVPFTAEQAADAVALAERQPGPSAAAILYQVAQIDDQVSGRARALAAAWRNGRRGGRYMTAVRVNLPLTRAIKPDAALAWFAAPAGRALLAAGDKKAALAWLLAITPPARDGRLDAAAAMLALAPLLYVGTVANDDPRLTPIMGTVLRGWWQGEVANDGAERYQRAVRFFGLLSALGRDVPDDLWLPLYAAPIVEVRQSLQSPLLLGLDRAAAAGRRGEVVLLSLLLLGDDGPGARDTLTLGRIVSALRQVGLAADAGAVALEGLLGTGF